MRVCMGDSTKNRFCCSTILTCKYGKTPDSGIVSVAGFDGLTPTVP